MVEEFLAALHFGVVHVAGGGDGQTTVPHHEVHIVLVFHLRQFHLGRDLVVHHQVVVDVGFHIAGEVVLREIVVELGLHIGVLRGFGGVGGGHVVAHFGAVRHVGDVPDGVGAGSVLQGAACEGVGVFLGVGGVAVIARRSEVGAGPHRGIESVGHEAVVVFLLVLRSQRVVGNGVNQASAIDADGRFQTADEIAVGDGLATHFERYIESVFGNVNLWIGEAITFTIRELVAPFIGVAQPIDLDFGLVHGCLERRDGLGLGHSSVTAQVGVVAVGEDEQVAVAPVVGAIAVHPHSVAIAGMAGDATAADVERPEAVERLVVLRVGTLKEVLAILEGGAQTGLLHSGRGVFVGTLRSVERGAQLATGVGVFADFGRDGVGLLAGGQGHEACKGNDA